MFVSSPNKSNKNNCLLFFKPELATLINASSRFSPYFLSEPTSLSSSQKMPNKQTSCHISTTENFLDKSSIFLATFKDELKNSQLYFWKNITNQFLVAKLVIQLKDMEYIQDCDHRLLYFYFLEQKVCQQTMEQSQF